MKRLSSRFHLALGLSSIVVTLLLGALFIGLVPDRDGALRAGRASLAETVAVGATVLLDDEDDQRLEQMLGFIVRRDPKLLTIALRQADGTLRLAVGQPPPPHVANAASTETHVRVPLVRDGAAWGQAELVFAPLHGEGLVAAWIESPAALIGAMGAACFGFFYFYLRRMLRHLDPSSVIPGRVRTAFDTLAEGLLVLDPKGRIVLANRAFMDVVGGDADKLVGQPVASLAWRALPDADAQADAAADPWAAIVAEGQPQRNVLMHLVDQHGRRRSFMVNGSPVPGAGGRAAGMLVSLDDVTALEEQELQLRLARDQAEAANRAKSDFLANMSHEIRTPMNAILGFAELLRRGWQQDSRDAQRHLDTILGSGRHLLALINDILDLSKVEAGRLEVDRIPCPVHEIVQEVAAILRVRAEEKGLALVVEFPQAMPATMLTDPPRLRQIVTNLVGNAIKFTATGRITLSVRVQLDVVPARLAIDVIDTGVGIPADRLEAIFDPFVQAEASTSRHFGGTGLGLAISRRFARALGGDIVATSVQGQGSTFHLTLDPGELDDVHWLAPEQLQATHRREAVEDTTRWVFGPKRVLVVDDGAENRELVRLVLENAGLVVIEAENGAVAIERVATDAPDLVLMDVQMPVMDGYTATRKLREQGCRLPVLALTANAMKGFEQDIEAAGFTGYLTKPVDIDALLAALALRLGGRPLEPGEDSGRASTWAVSTPAALTAAEASPAPTPAPTTAPAMPRVAETTGPIVSRLATHPRLARVVRTFGATLPGKLQAMRAALDARQLNELAELAHWLKGAGGTVGFDVFFEPAREFELLARAGRIDELEQGLQAIEALAARIVLPEEDTTAATTAA